MYHSLEEEAYFNNKAKTLYPLVEAVIKHYGIEQKVVFRLCALLLEDIVDFPDNPDDFDFPLIEEDDVAQAQKRIDKADKRNPDNNIPIDRYIQIIKSYDDNININRLADNLLQDNENYKKTGYCQSFWKVKKALHLLLNGVDWKSPAELHPRKTFL